MCLCFAQFYANIWLFALWQWIRLTKKAQETKKRIDFQSGISEYCPSNWILLPKCHLISNIPWIPMKLKNSLWYKQSYKTSRYNRKCLSIQTLSQLRTAYDLADKEMPWGHCKQIGTNPLYLFVFQLHRQLIARYTPCIITQSTTFKSMKNIVDKIILILINMQRFLKCRIKKKSLHNYFSGVLVNDQTDFPVIYQMLNRFTVIISPSTSATHDFNNQTPCHQAKILFQWNFHWKSPLFFLFSRKHWFCS